MEGFKESTAWSTTNPRYEETFDMVSDDRVYWPMIHWRSQISYYMLWEPRITGPWRRLVIIPPDQLEQVFKLWTTSSSAANAVLNS